MVQNWPYYCLNYGSTDYSLGARSGLLPFFFFLSFLGNTAMPVRYILSVAAFTLQWQSLRGSCSLNNPVWPSREKACQLLR